MRAGPTPPTLILPLCNPSNALNSMRRSRTLSKPPPEYEGAFAVETFKVKGEANKGRKMKFIHPHHNPFFWGGGGVRLLSPQL